MYEIGIALSRCMIDDEFRKAFTKPKTFSESNEFWHRFISRGKCEKVLTEFNKANIVQCGLVHLTQAKEVLGVVTHPNHLGGQFDASHYWMDAERSDTLFDLSSDKSNAFLLSTSSLVILGTIKFVGSLASKLKTEAKILDDNPLFLKTETDSELMLQISKVSSAIALMQIKMTNRANQAYEPDRHF